MSKDTFNEYFTDVSPGGKYFQLTFYTNEKEKFLAMETLARKCIDDDLDVEVVEVVRCENCRHYHDDDGGWCECHSEVDLTPEDYCSYGERREE